MGTLATHSKKRHPDASYTVLLRKLQWVPFAVMPLKLVNSVGNSGNATRLISARAKQDEPEPLPSTGQVTNCTLKPSNSICFARFLQLKRASVWHVLQLPFVQLLYSFEDACDFRGRDNSITLRKATKSWARNGKSKVEKLDEFAFQGLDVRCITS